MGVDEYSTKNAAKSFYVYLLAGLCMGRLIIFGGGVVVN
jgi:hypothetical protein